MGDEDVPASALDEKDTRIRFISEYILQSYKLKQEKWNKCIGLEENRVIILEFLEKPDVPCLIFTISSAGAITPSYQFPTSLKNSKAVYFIKRRGEGVSKEGIKSALIYGDLSYSPLEQLSALVDEVSAFTILTLITERTLYHVQERIKKKKKKT